MKLSSIGESSSPAWARVILRGARQAVQVCGQVEVIAHLQTTRVAYVIDALRTPPPQGGYARAGEVVGMDVIGMHVVLAHQRGRAAAQPCLGRAALAIGRIDAGNAQHARAHARPAQVPHRALGVHAAPGPRRGGRDGPRLGHARAAAVAIDAAGRAVHQCARQAAQPQHARQGHGAGVGPPCGARIALAGRRRQVQHARGEAREAPQGAHVVQITHERHGAGRAQSGHARGGGGQRQDARPWRALAGLQRAHGAQAHVAAADDQHTFTAETRRQRAEGVQV